ncbi:glycosyltransferase family 25 protein [Cognatishimia sp. SS12]|uniref:glycosyltransferase family 25 protein n=1 Tax=Cognatishimia sp. SS12 TaxID=2979465 RepID=UPI0023314148|nr:glycosyltransferase family 25 protein [Cognatishimia sp. SS12]MDC0737949.1 glycosyltransferase family 25 protein [Cognatishimia sp. SS12]
MAHSYIIHLERSTNRAALVAALQTALPNAKLLPAVDGRAMTDAARAEVMRQVPLKPAYPFGLMPSEIGCFLSHRKAWSAIAEGADAFGVVAEDDVVVGPEFAEVFDAAIAHADEDCLIRFPMKGREVAQKTLEQSATCHIFRPKEIGLTAALYILGRSAARKLVMASEKIDRPVDTWLQMRWETGVDSLTLWPSHIRSGAEATGGSTIQKKRSLRGEFTRAIARARYRAAITRLSKSS